MRGLFKKYISKCPTCLKSDIKSKDGQFSVILGTPRLSSLVGQESPVFHTVSLDIQGPWIVSNFTGAKRTRNKHGTHKVYGLIIVDLLSGAFCIEYLDHATASEVEAALKSFSALHRLPSKCIADAGSSLVSLEKNPLFSGIKRMGIQVETVETNHQLLNFSERTWQEVKGLLNSMRRNCSKTIYSQSETIVEIMRKVNLCASVVHSTPLLVKHEDRHEKLVMKESLLRPYLSGTALDQKMAQIIAGVSGSRDGLFEEVLSYNSTIREVAKKHILSYLREKGVSFPVIRRNGKQDSDEVTLPLVDDVVAYLSSDENVHLGVITKILKPNVSLVRLIKNGKMCETKMHVSLIKLIYRPSDPESFLHLVAISLRV